MKSKLTLGIAALFVAGSALAAVCPGPDTFGHTCSNEPAGCTTVADVSNNVPNMFDDACTNRAIGFTFNFYGAAVTTVGVGSNGNVQMGGCAAGGTDFTNDCPVPNTFTPNNSVFGVWDDLNPGNVAGRVQDGTVGAAPNRSYVVEYNNVPFFSGGGSTTFKVILDENGGSGEQVRVAITNSGQSDYTSGIENAGGTDGLSRWCNNGVGASCTLYSAAPAGGGGDCDLTPVLNALSAVETKLDTDVADAHAAILADISALATAVAEVQAANCAVIELLHTPQGRRTYDGTCGTFDWNFNNGGGE